MLASDDNDLSNTLCISCIIVSTCRLTMTVGRVRRAVSILHPHASHSTYSTRRGDLIPWKLAPHVARLKHFTSQPLRPVRSRTRTLTAATVSSQTPLNQTQDDSRQSSTRTRQLTRRWTDSRCESIGPHFNRSLVYLTFFKKSKVFSTSGKLDQIYSVGPIYSESELRWLCFRMLEARIFACNPSSQ